MKSPEMPMQTLFCEDPARSHSILGCCGLRKKDLVKVVYPPAPVCLPLSLPPSLSARRWQPHPAQPSSVPFRHTRNAVYRTPSVAFDLPQNHLQSDTVLAVWASAGEKFICIAVDKNNEGVVDALLAAGADLGEEGTSNLPLHAAARGGFCRSLEKLLRAGANVNWVDSKGRTALHAACSYSHEDAVEVLLRHNASVSLLCDEGLSPHDVVAVGLLQRQQIKMGGRRPFTLDAEETLVADRVCAMLRGAAWGRRGWLVMLRARHQGPARVIDASSLTLSSTSVEALDGDRAAPVGVGLADDDVDAGFAQPIVRSSNSTAAAAANLTLEHTVLEGGPGHEMSESLTTGTAVDGGDEDGGQAGGSGWPGAVEWVVGCPDDCGVFREILSFL